jgi:protein phosphatase
LSAFEVPRSIAGERLALGRLTVIDATNVQPEARKPLVELAPQRPLPAIILQRASSSQINHDAI